MEIACVGITFPSTGINLTQIFKTSILAIATQKMFEPPTNPISIQDELWKVLIVVGSSLSIGATKVINAVPNAMHYGLRMRFSSVSHV